MGISKAAKLAHERRVLKRLEKIDIGAKTAGVDQKGRKLITRMFQEALEDQKEHVRRLENSK